MTKRPAVPVKERPRGGHERLLELVRSPHRVLDVGCSTGYLAQRLTDLGATAVGGTRSDAGYRILEFDVTAPVPVVGTPRVEHVAHAIARLRPSLLAYQFVVAATPR